MPPPPHNLQAHIWNTWPLESFSLLRFLSSGLSLSLIMPYLTLAQMEAEIPADFLIQALDDDGDGEVDAIFAVVQEAVSDKIHGFLSQRFEVPFIDPVPPIVKQAARVFTGDMLYRRRGFKGDDNPFESDEDKLCKTLEKIGAGDSPLVAGAKQKSQSVVTITEPAKTTSHQNYLSS